MITDSIYILPLSLGGIPRVRLMVPAKCTAPVLRRSHEVGSDRLPAAASVWSWAEL